MKSSRGFGRPTHEYTVRIMRRGTRVHPDVILHCRYRAVVEAAKNSARAHRADKIMIYRDGEIAAIMEAEFKFRWLMGIPP